MDQGLQTHSRQPKGGRQLFGRGTKPKSAGPALWPGYAPAGPEGKHMGTTNQPRRRGAAGPANLRRRGKKATRQTSEESTTRQRGAAGRRRRGTRRAAEPAPGGTFPRVRVGLTGHAKPKQGRIFPPATQRRKQHRRAEAMRGPGKWVGE